MSGTEATLYDVRKGAAWITLNRPENRNALSAILVNELYAHLSEANNDPTVRSIVITGNGPAFCAGADLKSPPGQTIDGGGQSIPYPDVLKAILDSEKPVIGIEKIDRKSIKHRPNTDTKMRMALNTHF